MFAPGSRGLLGALLGVVVVGLVATTFAPPGPSQFTALATTILLTGLALFLAAFFRDPERAPGPGIVSAADGRVTAVAKDGDRWQIVVFMNVTNVHVNRFPIDGRVEEIQDAGSGYKAAFLADAAHNVRRHYTLGTSVGPVEVVQLTGVVARRIVSFVGVGHAGAKGERLGMIVLGSRVDVFLPRETTHPTVHVGDRVRAGVTEIAAEGPA